MRTATDLKIALLLAGHTAVSDISAIVPDVEIQPGNVMLLFVAGATAQQITDANAFLTAFDWSDEAQAVADNLAARTEAAALLTDPQALMKALRALMEAIRDEINILRQQIIGVQTQVWDPASIANGAGLTSPTVTVTGAAFGDSVDVCAPYTLQGLTATAYVSAANTVTVRLENQTGGAVNLASGTWRVVVRRHGAMPDRTNAQVLAVITNVLSGGSVDT